jgi:hypothetical protein
MIVRVKYVKVDVVSAIYEFRYLLISVFDLLFCSELGEYPVYAKIKDWQCSAIAVGIGCLFGYNRKEEMKPVYVRQTSMLKFQDRLTAEVRR